MTPSPDERLARFEASRPQLRAVAYRMLGSLGDADDAVQDAWLRLARSDVAAVANLGGWLTTVVARICLDQLRARAARREEPEAGPERARVPDPIVTAAEPARPDAQLITADALGLALMVVMDTLEPAERVAFVLHDLFALPFEDIAPLVERTPAAARQLASRARRRVKADAAAPDPDAARQRVVVDAFLAASRRGDLAALLAILDPDVVLRGDRGPTGPAAASRVVRGATAVAKGTSAGAQHAPPDRIERPVLVNGAAGIVVFVGGHPFSVVAFTVRGDRICEIDVLADPARLAGLGLEAFA